MYPGVGTFVLIRPAQTFYERINLRETWQARRAALRKFQRSRMNLGQSAEKGQGIGLCANLVGRYLHPIFRQQMDLLVGCQMADVYSTLSKLIPDAASGSLPSPRLLPRLPGYVGPAIWLTRSSLKPSSSAAAWNFCNVEDGAKGLLQGAKSVRFDLQR